MENHMNKRWTTVLSLLALLVVPAALAQNPETRGTLTAKDGTTLTLETIQGQVVTFEITDQSLLPQELSVGDTIVVHHLAGTGDGNLQPITEVLIADELTASGSADELTASSGSADKLTASSGSADEQPAADRRRRAEVLPETAGPLAALALIGLAATGGAAGLRRRRS
jgi:hypothetical protein